MHSWLDYLILLLLFSACQHRKNTTPELHIRPVKAVEASTLKKNVQQTYSGVVKAAKVSNLAFRIPGKIIEIEVETGTKIEKEEIIAQIQSKEYLLEHETAQNNYLTAKQIVQRAQRLLTEHAISKQEYEMAKVNYLQAYEALNVAQNNLNQTFLKAPYTGFIEKKQANPFDEVQAGQTIVKLVNPTELEIHFVLPETAFHLLQTPSKIQVEFDCLKGKLFNAAIKEYTHVSDGLGIPIVLKITDRPFASYQKLILPGFSCQINWEIQIQNKDYFSIPPHAIQKVKNKEYIWLVNTNDNTIHQQKIETFHLKNQVFVKSGLKPEDIIIVAGIHTLKEGQKVRINKN